MKFHFLLHSKKVRDRGGKKGGEGVEKVGEKD